mgnify:CR=1 FL=1
MKKEISPKLVSLAFGILTVSFLAAFAVFAWTEPSVAPPGGNVATPINTGSVEQIKTGNLTVNALGISASGNALLVPNGNVGIGTASPSYKLDVSGDIRAASLINTGGSVLPSSCTATNRGQQFLLQSGAGTADGFYICKKKSDNSYGWSALGSPEIVTIWERENISIGAVPTGMWCGGNPQLCQPAMSSKTFLIPVDGEILTCAAENYTVMNSESGGYVWAVGSLKISGPNGFALATPSGSNAYFDSKSASIQNGGTVTATCTGTTYSQPLYEPPGYSEITGGTTYCTFSCYYIKKK